MGTPTSVFFLSSILITLLPQITAQDCYNTGNFTTNSTYGKNRDMALSSLASNVTANGGFYTATIGHGSDTVYALGLCRPDISNQTCFDCIDSPSQSIIKNCPNQKEAVEWGPTRCIVRCSNKSFLGVMDTHPAGFVWNVNNVSNNMDEFGWALNSLVDSLVSKASMGSSRLKFASGKKTLHRILEYICSHDVYPRPIIRKRLTYWVSDIVERLDSGRPSKMAWIRTASKLFMVSRQGGVHHADEDASQSVDSFQLDFATIRAATNNFSSANKLGDPIKHMLLNWKTRYKIIVGIASGLLYFHEDSQLKIIHCDLKVSNVLLDGAMNPKIAHFGTARLFVNDQSRGKTKRIVGTYGYMPLEYANYGQFSVKTDAFSFGVLILEIMSGKKNGHSSYGEHVDHLPSYAWKKWREGKPLSLIDQTLWGGSKSEMLSLTLPSKPGFFIQSSIEPHMSLSNQFPSGANLSLEDPVNLSINEASITEPWPR
ncbi:hypothetical protein ACSBR2_014843 [Camellia fascicularis]